jgi:tetratricopeptide (TPR) repeat protein
MSLLRRLFSADYRRALAAEAAGEYVEAARAYALAGERAKVAEMHLCRAERARSSEDRLKELRAGIRWADLDNPNGRELRRRLARGLFDWAQRSGLLTESDRRVAREAAALWVETGDFSAAGECYELLGDDAAAAETYQRAGDLDRLERVLEREEANRGRLLVSRDAFEEYRALLRDGAPARALDALSRALSVASGDSRAELERLSSVLRERLVRGGAVMLVREGRPVRYIGHFPFIIGRESDCGLPLRDPNVSRRHAQIDLIEDQFVLSDLDSKNGISIAGVPIGGALRFGSEGEIDVGQVVRIRFRTAVEGLHLEVLRGLDRGVIALAGRGPLPLFEGVLDFVEGRPRVCGPGLRLNGGRPLESVELCRGDVLEFGDHRVEVR